MKIILVAMLGALALAGCATSSPSNPVTEANVRRLVDKCASDPSGPVTPAIDRCFDRESGIMVARHACAEWQIAPNLIDRCTRNLNRYAVAFRQCRHGKSLPGDREAIVACAKAKSPEGYNWATERHA